MAPSTMKILVINPNSSHAMTEGMEKAINGIDLPDYVKVETYTAPAESPASIDNDDDIRSSGEIVFKDLQGSNKLEGYDGILVACYSVHTLVDKLARQYHGKLAVTGIFEASILAAAALLPHTSAGPPESQWGIVTTGKFWEKHLEDGVGAFLGEKEGTRNLKFRGVASSGLTAGDFHHVSPEEVQEKLIRATETLLGSGGISVVAMGCGGMAGLEDTIRATAVRKYGEEKGGSIYVVDGVKAGILQLEQMIRSQKAFQKPEAQ